MVSSEASSSAGQTRHREVPVLTELPVHAEAALNVVGIDHAVIDPLNDSVGAGGAGQSEERLPGGFGNLLRGRDGQDPARK